MDITYSTPEPNSPVRKEARANAYEATKLIEFDNKYMRNDIGKAIDEA